MKRTPKEQRYNEAKVAIGIRINRDYRLALPDPMPGNLPDGTPVWLHYAPLRWERHP